MVTCTGHIGIHEWADGRTDVRTYVVRTDVDDVMAIKPNFLTSMGYHNFLTMVLRAHAELRYNKQLSNLTCWGPFGRFCTDLAALGPYCDDLGPIFPSTTLALD